ncbi:MAG: hypothetical protein WBG41_13310 [Acidimicrobiales bacterium]
MKRSVVVLAVVVATLLCAACSSRPSSPSEIAAAKRTVAHWQSVVNEDQARLSRAEGCPLTSAANCTPQVTTTEALQAQAKLRADEARLFTSENELSKDQGQ